MKVVAIFLIALVATSYASQTLFKNLAKISKDPTGAAILAAISLNVKAKVPTDDIALLLNDLLSDLLNQSQVFESQTAEKNERLTNAIASEQALDAVYQATIETLQGTIDNAQSSLATAQDSLANNQQALADEQQGIQDRDADAAVVVPELNEEIQGLQDAIAATEEAGQKMQAYKQSSEGSASFIQMGTSIKDKIKKVTTSIQSMKKKLAKHSNMFTPLVRELIDLSSSLDQSKADRVISLLQEIHDNLVQALNDTENRKATYVSNYNDRQAQAQQNVANYEAVIDQLNQTIQGLQDKIAQAQSDLAASQQVAAENQSQLANDQANLETLQADYAVRRPRFDRLISLVRQVIAYFEQNLQGVDDYVTQTIDTL